jgi:zinc transporter 1/2/3
MALRLLLGAGHAHGPFEDEPVDDHHDHGHEHEHGIESTPEYTLDLRIAAIFVVLAAAMIMGLPPIYVKYFQSPDALFARLLRAFAGGVILSLALVHIIPSAMFQLAGLTAYSFGGVAVLAGIFLLIIIDTGLQAALTPKDTHAHSHDEHRDGGHGLGHVHTEIAGDLKVAVQGGPSKPTHTHQCLRSVSQEHWVASAEKPLFNVKQYVTAYTMELGCIFHSVTIGVSLGVMTDDRAAVVIMMIAVAIHQGLEGLSLGTVLAVTNFSKLKKTAMLLMYCITTPVGIAVGIAISASYNPASVTSRAVQGVINGLSGGMLLYISMYQLIAEEFSRQDLIGRPGTLVLMYLAMLLGGAAMCVLAIWS